MSTRRINLRAHNDFEAQARDTRQKIQTLRQLLLRGGLRETLVNERLAPASDGTNEPAEQPADAAEGAPEADEVGAG